MPEKIDVQRLAREAINSAAQYLAGNPSSTQRLGEVFHDHFARLVLEEAAKVCDAGMDGTSKPYADACFSCASLIRSLKP